MKRKLISTVLATTMLASVLTACGTAEKTTITEGMNSVETTKDEGTSEKKEFTFPLAEPVTFTAFSDIRPDNKTLLVETTAMKKITEITNVQWDVESVLMSALTEKRQLALSTGDYPEVFLKSGISESELEKYGKEGVLIPLNDLIDEYAPNLKAIIEEKEIADFITSSDGNIYSLPLIEERVGASTPTLLWMNTTWLKNVGLEMPSTSDEIYTAWTAFKEQDANGNGDPNDEIPFVGCTDQAIGNKLIHWFSPMDVSSKCRLDGDSMIYVPTSPEYKEFLAFLAKCYKEGLIEKNTFSQQIAAQRALGATGDVAGSFFDWAPYATAPADMCREFSLTSYDETKKPYATSSVLVGGMAITDICENPELAVAWADLLYTEEYGGIATLGVEGIDYEIVDDKWVRIPVEGDASAFSTNITGGAAAPTLKPQWVSAKNGDPMLSYQNSETDRLAEQIGGYFPVLHLGDNQKRASDIMVDINPYVDQFLAQVAVGEVDLDAEWDGYCEKLEKMGLSELMGFYQEAYDAKSK